MRYAPLFRQSAAGCSRGTIQVNARRESLIQYADLGDIVQMINLKTGGGLQDAVSEAKSLVREPTIPAGSGI
jgi:hypothetical protein